MRLGVLCSGGDAPGMNACVRAVARSAAALGCEVVGIRHGYQGLLDSDFFVNERGEALMTPRSVSHIIQHGGTILRSRRCEGFRTDEGLKRAADNLRKQNVDGVIVIDLPIEEGDVFYPALMEYGVDPILWRLPRPRRSGSRCSQRRRAGSSTTSPSRV